jgi:PAS domain S-box-containing protein
LLNKRKDGSEFPVFLSTSIVKDKENKVLGLIGVATDITEHKHAEETLLKLSSAFEQTVDTLVITDLNGNIEYVNQAFEDTTGYSSEEALGKTPRIIKSGRLSQQYYEDMWRTILSGKVFRSEILNKKKNGELYYVEKTISPIFDKNRTITNFVGTGVDITKRKHVEKELIEAKERAEESDRLKTSFLNNISHEIRTPFNGLLGFLSLIQDEELPTSERDEYINIINKSAYRLMNTINDIVEISQIQAGQITLTSSKTEIRRLISEIYSRFKPDAESNGLKFFLNNNLPNNIESIYTDSLKLNTILSHLIGNAIKFTKEGSIQFEIRLVDQGNEFGRDKACIVSTPSKLQFSVKDTGVGIAKSKIQAIFEKFMQADGSNNRQFEGSGLGLSIAKAYVEMLGGKIWVESEEGIGSTFYFSIPYITDTKVKQDMANLSSYREDKTQLDISKVLIAEDDETSASFIKEIVSKFTKEVFIAKNGIEAVNLCQKNPDLDLILMDIQMPELNGYKATQQIREFNKDVIIIAQTAFALSGDKEKSLDAGCNDYITKPINQDQLIALIKKYFDQK